MATPEQHFFESQRLRLSYWDWGNPTAPPMVLVHGGRDHSRAWDRIAAAFCDAYHVVTPDLRGHGDSDWAVGSQYGVTDLVPDLLRLLEIVGTPAVVMAHSYGGQVATMTAATYPDMVSALISIEGTASNQPPAFPRMSPEWVRTWVGRVREFEVPSARVYKTVEEAAARIAEANPRLPADFVPDIARYAVKPVEGGYVWKFDNWVHGRTSMDIRTDEREAFWGAIACPVLLFYGELSHMAHRQGVADAEHFKDARAILVPEAAHWVHHDRPDLVISEVRTFLAAATA